MSTHKRTATILMTFLVAAAFTATCREDPPWGGGNGLDMGTDTDADTDSFTDTLTGPPVDCSLVPDAPIAINELDAPRGYHGLAFDEEGYIYGMDLDSMIKSTYDNQSSVFAPNIGNAEGILFAPNGNLLVAHLSGDMYSYDSSGIGTFLTDAQGAYGITLGPDNEVYVAGGDEIFRLNYETGEKEILIDTSTIDELWSTQTVNFSPDDSTMYITTMTGNNVWAVDLDDNLNPEGDPYVFAYDVGAIQDSLGVDACGNLYVAEMSSRNLYRISPQGEVEIYIDWEAVGGGDLYGHGLSWGSGIGGWKKNAIYMPQPFDGNTVVEVEIGVPSR